MVMLHALAQPPAGPISAVPSLGIWNGVIVLGILFIVAGSWYESRKNRWIQGYRLLTLLQQSVPLNTAQSGQRAHHYLQQCPPGWSRHHWRWWRVRVLHQIRQWPPHQRQPWRIWWRIWRIRHVHTVYGS